MEKDTSKTKQYKIKPSKKTKKYNKDQEAKQNFKKIKKKKHKVFKRIILTLFLLVMLAGLGGVGIVAGIFFSDKWALTAEDLIANGNTEIFDSEGKQIAVLQKEDANRKIISLDEMGKYTANAYIAIEDKRFYEHSGIDIMRTASATVSYILHRGEDSSVGGGSTITQQLVKNLMKDDDDRGMAGVERKIREMSRAYQIETMLTKPQILEKYLNQIFVGGNYNGVEYGARYYFAKSAKDLDLAESAFLAGINNAPNMYNPYDKENDHSELIKNRTKLVLSFMKEQNRISSDPEEAEKLYNEAVAKVEKGLEFKQGKIEIGGYSHFIKTALDEVIQDLADEKDVDFNAAKDMILSGGYKLYTTQNTKIQERVIKEMAKDTYIETRTITEKDEDGKSKKVTIHTNAGMTIIDHTNGKVVALGGDLNQDLGEMGTNYATSEARQTGSSIKPLANIAPGLEEKVITAATVYDDTRTDFGKYAPKNVGSYCGLCTVRRAIERSSNVVNLKIMSNVGLNKSIDYLHEFGLNTYVKGEEVIGLAIGGSTHSSSTLQMAAAYAALANKGVYIEPTFYTKLEDSNGNTVVESHQETRRVISEANAFIVSDILTDVVTGAEGTAGRCAISGMDVAAKTGTTDIKDNKWLCGYTPYYAAAVWYGFGYTNKVGVSKDNNAIYIWANVMKDVHKDLAKKRFTKPANIVTAKICKQSGKVATSECKNTYTEYFVSGTVPTACDGHVTLKICKETGKIATEYCPEVEEKTYTMKPEKERNAKWKPVDAKANEKYEVPEEECNVHTVEANQITIENVVGKTESEAMLALAGLDIRVIYETHSDMENGVVIRQSLEEGTKVNKGVAIIITVNKIESSVEPPSEGEVTPPTPTQKPDEPEEPDSNTQTNTEENNEVDTGTEGNTV